MRHLGVDPGEKRIGLALSDEDGRLALPHETVVASREAEAGQRIAEEARRHSVGCVVMGLPLKLDGSEGASARRARRLAAAIERELDVPVVLWDERLTTAAAERSLTQLGVRGARRRQVVDQAAAALLLQSYLDAKTSRTWVDQDIEDFAGPGPGPGARRGRRPSRGR